MQASICASGNGEHRRLSCGCGNAEAFKSRSIDYATLEPDADAE